jgi:hypothetical protein
VAAQHLSITKEISAALLADSALAAFSSLPISTQELLLQSKNEQTFSARLAAGLETNPLLDGGSALVEIKGTDYTSGKSKSKNFHDIAIVNQQAKPEVIIENKVWYHFDGAKGKKNAKVEPGVLKQLDADIAKIKLTLKDLADGARGFILMHLVTPADIASIPKSYRQSHQNAFARVGQDWPQYRAEGVHGIKRTLESRSSHFVSEVVIKSALLQVNNEQGFIDILCVEVQG